MGTMKSFSVVAIALFALSAIGVANASASTFTYSAPGELTGHALETQKFVTNGGTIECSEAPSSGLIESTEAIELHVSIEYKQCKAFGFPVDVTAKATFRYTANGKMHFTASLVFTVTGGIFGECTITIGEQEVGALTYTNNSGKLKVTPNVTGIAYTSTGGLCGSSGTNGTYTGASEIERVGGGSISWDE
jgi:hypothetical protein